MPNSKELKNRINSVSNTRKITNAMYLISSAKLRKAREALEKTRPFFYRIEREMSRLFQTEETIRSPYFERERSHKGENRIACLLITADKGLAGAYNHNLLKEAEARVKKCSGISFYVVGEYGKRYLEKHRLPIRKNFEYTAQNPNYRRAREIATILLEDYDREEVDEVWVIYSDIENELDCVVRTAKILPLKREIFENVPGRDREPDKHFAYFPSVSEVINSLVPGYVAGFVYGALTDSYCAEQNARMNAMSSANNNAEELLGELYIEYNRVRQSAITQEITEVAAGAKAQKKKKKKKKVLASI